jgi:hypothetical protein
MSSMKTNSPGGMKSGGATFGLQSRDVVPDKDLAGHSNPTEPQPRGRVFGESPARADDAERDNLKAESEPTPIPNAY